MIATQRIYLDANIFIYGLEGGNEASERIAELLIRASTGANRLLTSEFVAAELFIKPYREDDKVLVEQYEFVLSGRGIEVLPLTAIACRQAAALRAARPALKLPDAIHVAVAMTGGASYFLTADRGITSPFEMFGPSGVSFPDLTVIRPDIPTLDALLKSLDS